MVRKPSTLLRFREWLNVPEAARHLSLICDEAVSEADVLRLALDGHLTLSVRFVNHARARHGKRIPLEQAERTTVQLSPRLDPTPVIVGDNLGDGTILVFSKEIVTLDGVGDLPMFGNERLDVEHLYQNHTDGPDIELINIDGTYVTWHGDYYKIMEMFPDKKYSDPDSWFPAGGLPEDSVFVVRTEALNEFENKVREDRLENSRRLATRERTSLLLIIKALAKLARIDLTHPSAAAASIADESQRLGTPVAQRTIEEHLKRIPDASERRASDS